MRAPVIQRTCAAAAALLLGILFSGCVSTSQPLFGGGAQRDDEYGLVVLYRPANLVGVAGIPVVTIDEAPIAELTSGSYCSFYLLPGDYRIVNKVKGWEDWGVRMQDITIQGGEEHYYRYSVHLLGGFEMTYVNPNQALNEVAQCRLAEGAAPLSRQPKPFIAAEAKSRESSGRTAVPPEQKKTDGAERKPSPADAAASGAKLPVVSVLDFKVEGIAVAESVLIIDMLSNAIVKTRRFIVIDRSQREKLLKEIEFSNSACSEENCQLQIGKLLAADNIVVGSIGKVGARYVINVKLLEVETSKAAGTASEVYKSLEELVDNCQSIAEKLMD